MTLGPSFCSLSCRECTKDKLRNEGKERSRRSDCNPSSSQLLDLPLSCPPLRTHLTLREVAVLVLAQRLRHQSKRPAAGWEASKCRGGGKFAGLCVSLFFAGRGGESCVKRRVQWVWRESGCPVGTGGTSLTVRHTPYTYRCKAGGKKKKTEEQTGGFSLIESEGFRKETKCLGSSIHTRTYPCPQGRSSVSAMTSQHSVQQLSRMLTCFNNARRRCLQETEKAHPQFVMTSVYFHLHSNYLQ